MWTREGSLRARLVVNTKSPVEETTVPTKSKKERRHRGEVMWGPEEVTGLPDTLVGIEVSLVRLLLRWSVDRRRPFTPLCQEREEQVRRKLESYRVHPRHSRETWRRETPTSRLGRVGQEEDTWGRKQERDRPYPLPFRVDLCEALLPIRIERLEIVQYPPLV